MRLRPLLVASLLIALFTTGCGEQPTPANASAVDAAAPATGALYELRIYHPAPGRHDALLSRFRDHTASLFERHGMTNVGYWVPEDTTDRRLLYLLAYPDAAARDSAWAGFLADPDWIAARDSSEANGPLVERIESTYLAPTDFSALR